jgi:hypothetical protein
LEEGPKRRTDLDFNRWPKAEWEKGLVEKGLGSGSVAEHVPGMPKDLV